MKKKPKSKLRQEARNRDCKVNYIGYCRNDTETTVLAHPNDKALFGVGVGMKPDDMFGAHCCSICHDIYDGRTTAELSDEEIKIGFYRGVFRTQNILLQEGKL